MIELQNEILDRLSSRGVLAYVAVMLAAPAVASTAVLAGFVRVSTPLMREGLRELGVESPGLVTKRKDGWHCGEVKAGEGVVEVPNLIADVYREFVDELKLYWDYMNAKSNLPFHMGAADGAAIKQFLSEHRNWTKADRLTTLRNRAKSPVNRTAPLHTWVRKLEEYAAGPLNEYGRPQEGTGKHGKAIGIEQGNRAARQTASGSGR